MRRLRVTAALIAALAAGTAVPLCIPTPAAADDVRDNQWQIRAIDATKAWERSTGRGVTVAVIDSGVDASHPDLRGQVLSGVDLVDGTTDGRKDSLGHGTAVAAFIAGRGTDESGVIGIAYDAKILPIRILNAQNRYESADVLARAIRYAVDDGASVINLSLGSATSAQAVSDAIAYAMANDVVVVACAGNVSSDQGTAVWHPAREPGVIAVSGVSRTGSFWPGSLRGDQVTLAAPSAALTGAHPGRQYEQIEGTSFAAPLVSASVALIRSAYPEMSAPDVINRLIRTAVDLGVQGRDPLYGYGLVDPARALTADLSSVPTNPLLSGATDAPGSGASALPSAAPAPADMAWWTTPSVAMVVLLAAAALLVVHDHKRTVAVTRSTGSTDEPSGQPREGP